MPDMFSYMIPDTGTTDAHSSLTSRDKYGIIFENALSNKNYSAARSAFEKFDEQTQNDKHLSLQYMLACEHLGEKLFRKSADRYISLFPDEPTPYLLMMKQYADTKNYGDYSRAIDKLDTLLQIDPFLNYFRGNVIMKLGDLRGASHFYQEAFDYDPGIWQNTEKLVACKVVNNELVQANEAINLYIQTPGYRKELVEDPLCRLSRFKIGTTRRVIKRNKPNVSSSLTPVKPSIPHVRDQPSTANRTAYPIIFSFVMADF